MRRSSTIVSILLGAGFCAVALLCLQGCDTSSSTENVKISPASVRIRYRESISFAARGGYDYTWGLSEPSWGTLSTFEGPTTTYTSYYEPGGTNFLPTQVLSVTSRILLNERRGATNDQSYVESAEAYIIHRDL